MQSGIDSSRLRIAYDTERQSTAVAQGEQATQQAAKGSSKDFFGEDGLSFGDVLDAINPLNHIPIVSDIVANITGHRPSTASKLVGGTLLGGPIGFVTSLAKVIFEDGAGKTPGEAIYAAVTGDPLTQTARASTANANEQEVANVDTAVEPVEATELAALEPAANNAALVAQSIASTTTTAARTTSNAVLDLYGASTDSAHRSYKKAQLLPYLREVNTSKVL